MSNKSITPEQWKVIQAKWEGDPRPGYKWLEEELELPVTRQAIGKRSRKEEWKKVSVRKEEAEFRKERIRAGVGKPETKGNNSGGSGNGPPTGKNSNIPGTGDDDSNLPITEEDANNVGRPTKYRSEYAHQAYKLCLLGYTDKGLADFFMVAESTLNLWKKEHPEFSESLRSGKCIADAEVANSVYVRATGYTHDAVHVSVFMGDVTLTDIQKHHPPDIAAAKMWLYNRQPHLWKAKVEVADEVDDKDIVTDDELERIYLESMEKSRLAAEKVIGRGERLGITIEQVSDAD